MAFCVTNINVIDFPDTDPGGSCLLSSSNNIAIVRGQTFTMIFDLLYNTTAQDGTVTSSPADLDGYSINMSIRTSSSSNNDLLFVSAQNRMINIDYDTSRATVNIPVKHTSRIPVGNQYYFVRLIASDANTQKIIQGIATVSDS